MGGLTYITGDATAPVGDGNKLICHICNDIGGWGRGFVVELSRRWPEPEARYREWYKNRSTNDFELGAIQLVEVGQEISVANMVAQHGIKSTEAGPPIRYEAVESCLRKVAVHAAEHDFSVHMPRIGAGLAGGDWQRIESIILDQLAAKVSVTVYDFA